MLTPDNLKTLLHKKNYTRLQKLLFCLAIDPSNPKQVKDIREIASLAGFNSPKIWNISDILGKSKGLAIRTPSGWEISPEGRSEVIKLASEYNIEPPKKISTSLRSHLATIQDDQIRAFVSEAIECFECGLYRGAVVLSWVGAVSLLYEYVLQNKLTKFNAEAKRRDSRWKVAKKREDFGRMKEFEFLQILTAISIIDKSVKLELEKRLQLRNSCGHPTSLRISENIVAAHIEVLILNVFSQFSV